MISSELMPLGNNMIFSAEYLAELIQGQVEGNPEKTINGLSKIETAGPEDLSFIANPKYLPFLQNSEAGILIIQNDLDVKTSSQTTYIKVEDPYLAFTQLMKLYSSAEEHPKGIHATAIVDEKAEVNESSFVGAQSVIEAEASISASTVIMPQVYIGRNVSIGKNCVIHPGARIYANSIIGDNCVIHSGAVIGSDGFGFAPKSDGSFDKIPQLGNVVMGNSVEIGANTTIDRATMGSTVLEDGVKLDNLVQIGHNVSIGENTVIAAQSGVSGSTKIGRNCFVGGQVGFVGHITIADGSMFGARTGVNRSLKEENKKWDGMHALPYRDSLKSKAFFRRLPQFEERLRKLEKMFAESKVIN